MERTGCGSCGSPSELLSRGPMQNLPSRCAPDRNVARDQSEQKDHDHRARHHYNWHRGPEVDVMQEKRRGRDQRDNQERVKTSAEGKMSRGVPKKACPPWRGNLFCKHRPPPAGDWSNSKAKSCARPTTLRLPRHRCSRRYTLRIAAGTAASLIQIIAYYRSQRKAEHSRRLTQRTQERRLRL